MAAAGYATYQPYKNINKPPMTGKMNEMWEGINQARNDDKEELYSKTSWML